MSKLKLVQFPAKNKKTYEVAICPKCKGDMWFIFMLVGDDNIEQIQCATCEFIVEREYELELEVEGAEGTGAGTEGEGPKEVSGE